MRWYVTDKNTHMDARVFENLEDLLEVIVNSWGEIGVLEPILTDWLNELYPQIEIPFHGAMGGGDVALMIFKANDYEGYDELVDAYTTYIFDYIMGEFDYWDENDNTEEFEFELNGYVISAG